MAISKRRIRRNFVRARAHFHMAFDAVKEGATMRSAARMAKLPLFTFHLRCKKIDDNPKEQPLHHRRNLTAEEEDTLMS